MSLFAHRSSRSTPFADIYFRNFPKDALPIKLLVSLIISFEILQSILSLVDGFRVFGSNWGDPNELTNLGLGWLSVVGLSAISEFFVRV
jgi:hypothetical protein